MYLNDFIQQHMQALIICKSIFQTFAVGSSSQLYILTVSGYSRDLSLIDPGDSLIYHSGMKFTTYDNDNDQDTTKNCAASYKVTMQMFFISKFYPIHSFFNIYVTLININIICIKIKINYINIIIICINNNIICFT